MLGYFYKAPIPTMDLVASPKQKVTKDDVPKILSLLQTSLGSLPEKDWSRDTIMAAIEPVITSSGFKKGQVLWPLRVLLTGREYSAGAYEVAALLGKEETMKRLKVTL